MRCMIRQFPDRRGVCVHCADQMRVGTSAGLVSTTASARRRWRDGCTIRRRDTNIWLGWRGNEQAAVPATDFTVRCEGGTWRGPAVEIEKGGLILAARPSSVTTDAPSGLVRARSAARLPAKLDQGEHRCMGKAVTLGHVAEVTIRHTQGVQCTPSIVMMQKNLLTLVPE